MRPVNILPELRHQQPKASQGQGKTKNFQIGFLAPRNGGNEGTPVLPFAITFSVLFGNSLDRTSVVWLFSSINRTNRAMNTRHTLFPDASPDITPRSFHQSLPDSPLGQIVIVSHDLSQELVNDDRVLKQFIQLSGGALGRIVVICAATVDPIGCGRRYASALRGFGAGLVHTLYLDERAQVDDEHVIGLLTHATGLLLLGQDPAQLAMLFQGTLALRTIRQRDREGYAVATTKAGTFLLSGNALALAPAIVSGPLVSGEAHE